MSLSPSLRYGGGYKPTGYSTPAMVPAVNPYYSRAPSSYELPLPNPAYIDKISVWVTVIITIIAILAILSYLGWHHSALF